MLDIAEQMECSNEKPNGMVLLGALATGRLKSTTDIRETLPLSLPLQNFWRGKFLAQTVHGPLCKLYTVLHLPNLSLLPHSLQCPATTADFMHCIVRSFLGTLLLTSVSSAVGHNDIVNCLL